ncbi:MAG: M16 family metallopeptidase [Beijerinckiaceae bacterium]
MKNFFSRVATGFCAAAIVLFGHGAAQAQSTNTGQASIQKSYGISIGKTPGGIQLVHMRLPDEKEQALTFYWQDQHALHQVEKTGLVGLGAGLVIGGGAGALDAGAFEEELKDLGSSISLNQGRVNTQGSLIAPMVGLEATGKLLASALTEPRLPKITLERRKRFFINGLKAADEKPENIASKALSNLITGDHQVTRLNNLKPETLISDVTVADVDQWRKSALARGNLTVVAAGPLTREDAAGFVDRVFGGLPEFATLKPAVPFKPASLNKTIVIERNVPQTIILMGAPTEWAPGKEGIERNIALNVLGGDFKARLFVAVREKLGASYGASASIIGVLDEHGIFNMQTSVAHDKTAAALASIREEYRRFLTDGVTSDEVEPLKRRIIAGLPDQMRRSGSAAGSIRASMLNGMGFDAADDQPRRIAAITADSVNTLIRKHLPAGLTTILVTPSAAGLNADCVIASVDELAKCTKA